MKTVLISLSLAALAFGGAPLQAQSPEGEWRHYAGDSASSRYSPLTEINRSNVSRLRPTWEWRESDRPRPKYGNGTDPTPFEATPLVIDGVLYTPTSFAGVAALDPTTGRHLWSYDSPAHEWGTTYPPASWMKQRGLAAWKDGQQTRIFFPSAGRLIALDAKTGRPIVGFGTEGIADLTENLVWSLQDKTHYFNTSPPVIYKNLIIVGSSIPDSFVYPQNPPGDIQAFDVRTGDFVWSFHTVPQAGEYGNNTWEDESWKRTGHANAWPPMTLDEERGLLYVPLTSPGNDYYGGDRKGDNLFSGSLVCLDANTGERKWHFQTVHHDLWDLDGVMTPNLVTIRVDGKTIDAVAAVSKTGYTYVFDRVTGEPVWPIEERPVPQTDIPGEQTAPTQPFPTKPPPFLQPGFTADDVVDFTPEIRAKAMEILRGMRMGPIFTPPSREGTVMRPSNVGGANWGGASVDPERGILYVKAKTTISIVTLAEQQRQPGSDPPQGWSYFPYKHTLARPTIGNGLFVSKPPYGAITAIDLNRGEILWQVPSGDIPEIRNDPLMRGVDPPPLGAIGNAGLAVTAGGLLFTAPGDKKLYALDAESGKVLWSGDLPQNGEGSPMTYQGPNGKQYVAVASGKGAEATLTGFALP